MPWVFENAGIPTQWLASSADKKSFRAEHDSIKLMTTHSSKDLEFPLVAIAGLGYLPHESQEPAAEAKLLYVAMTRATDKLLLTCYQRSAFVRLLTGNHRATEDFCD
jgi:superfamily I DNA/RNA helicase